MDNIAKARIMHKHMLTDHSISALSDTLGIYGNFILSLRDDDLIGLETNSIFFNAFYSPASSSTINVNVPINSKIITFDVNFFKRFTKEEMVAILLHELGHAFNPNLRGETSEFVADDFAIQRGYSHGLKSSLEKRGCKVNCVKDGKITNFDKLWNRRKRNNSILKKSRRKRLSNFARANHFMARTGHSLPC